MWALGLVLWLFDRETGPARDWLEGKFAKLPDIAKINIAALEAGHAFGETMELAPGVGAYQVPPAVLPTGEYRNMSPARKVSAGGSPRARIWRICR